MGLCGRGVADAAGGVVSVNAAYRFPEARILVFAKAPLIGRVKTRLISAVGAMRAMRLYRLMLASVLQRLADARIAPIEIHAAPDARHPWLRRLAGRVGASLAPQVEGDLGRRMAWAARHAHRDADMVLLIGADGVWLCPQELSSAFSRLQAGATAILGPADDGGYVLLGLRRGFDARVFQGLPWGGPRVAAITRARLRLAGVAWGELSSRPDLDTPRDLRRWLRARRLGGSHLQNTCI